MKPIGRLAIVAILGGAAAVVHAHSGPPFPLVSDYVTGSYTITIWTDPDSTDDGSAAGQFWVVIQAAKMGSAVPTNTRATVSITPIDRHGPSLTAQAALVGGDVGRQFAALVLDHEGRFGVRVHIDGPLGPGQVDAQVDATYDLRPRPILIVVYLVPFLLVGFLWVKLLVRRKAGSPRKITL